MQHDKLYVQAFREIRAYITRNNLQPGDLLPSEQAMCEMLGVSRNVLREAIKSMELMGMAQSRPGRGTELKAFSLDFVFQNVMFFTVGEDSKAIREMLMIRKKLDLAYMREAYHSLKPEDIAHIREILERIKHEWQQHIFFHADDKDFHMALFSRLNNPTLLSLMDAIWSVDEYFQKEEKFKYLDDTVIKHEKIVHALEAHNEEAFVAAMLTHFSSGKYTSQDSFEEY